MNNGNPINATICVAHEELFEFKFTGKTLHNSLTVFVFDKKKLKLYNK